MASSRKYLHQIQGRYPRLDTEDLIAMINALASVWGETKQPPNPSASHQPTTQAHYRLASQILCVLPSPSQPPSLPSQVSHLAKTFSGISRNPNLRKKFRKSISIGLLATCQDADAVLRELSQTGIGGLFRL